MPLNRKKKGGEAIPPDMPHDAINIASNTATQQGTSYSDYSSGKTWNFQQGPIDKLRGLYGGLGDKDIERAAAGKGSANGVITGLNYTKIVGVFPPHSTLVGVRDGNLSLPVFYSTYIQGQKPGAFWTFEDSAWKRSMMQTSWVNVVPKGTPESPMIDPKTGVYLFEWSANVGDATARTGLGAADFVGHTVENLVDGQVNQASMGLVNLPKYMPTISMGFDETPEDKAARLAAATEIKGGKRTKKRKMNKRKKTLRKKSKRKRKTVKGGKRRKSKKFKRTRK